MDPNDPNNTAAPPQNDEPSQPITLDSLYGPSAPTDNPLAGTDQPPMDPGLSDPNEAPVDQGIADPNFDPNAQTFEGETNIDSLVPGNEEPIATDEVPTDQSMSIDDYSQDNAAEIEGTDVQGEMLPQPGGGGLPPLPGRSKLPFIILGVVGVVIVIAAAALFVLGSGTKKSTGAPTPTETSSDVCVEDPTLPECSPQPEESTLPTQEPVVSTPPIATPVATPLATPRRSPGQSCKLLGTC